MNPGLGADVARVWASVITLCSAHRLAHVRAQLAALSGVPGIERVVVWIGDDEPPTLDVEIVLHVPPGVFGMRLAAARNAGATAARGELLIFLDADCVPGPDLLEGYRRAAAAHPHAVLCGPVTYLPPGVDASDTAQLLAATAPHPARPNPPAGAMERAADDEYALFWSLSFAMRASVWTSVGGFDERYEGYGGEDTDFAFALRDAGIPLVWVGGAHAYHQYHETSTPPWRHLDDILRNGALFAEKWGEWPMAGWLDAFAEAGAITWDGGEWVRRKG